MSTSVHKLKLKPGGLLFKGCLEAVRELDQGDFFSPFKENTNSAIQTLLLRLDP